MGKIKITFRVDSAAYQSAKEYARKHGTTVTNLVDAFLRSLDKLGNVPHNTPILKDLSGSLSSEASDEDYHRDSERKYLGNKKMNH